MKTKKFTPTYTLMGELMASATEPLPEFWRNEQVRRMREGLQSIESGDNPTPNDWRLCSDAVNLMETLVIQGVAEDTQGLLTDAVNALGRAGDRHMKGSALRLSGAGIQAVRAVLEDYSEMLAVLPARTMFRCHRVTEKRIAEILRGRSQPHDVAILAV